MLTPVEKREYKGYFNSEIEWLLCDKPALGRGDVVLPPEVASTSHFYRPHLEKAFGLLGVLRARGIESVLGIAVYELGKVRPEEWEYINDPGCAYPIYEDGRWIPDGPRFFLSQKELRPENAFLKHMSRFYHNPDHEYPGYVDFTVYADPKKLLSEYGAEFVRVISQQEQRERREKGREFFEALMNSDSAVVEEVVKEIIFGMELDGFQMGDVDAKELAEALMESIDFEEPKTP